MPQEQPTRTPPSLQGWPVIKQLKGAVYLRIPPELQQPTGGCSCQYCCAHPDEVPMWDTLAVPLQPTSHPHALTWTVHAPEWGG